ncbi:MAG: hypothetical protein HZB80_07075 [Deltaproteobacteria bacterium]|nr:hypothetical protein [Deltaproteobacteria bacterium]
MKMIRISAVFGLAVVLVFFWMQTASAQMEHRSAGEAKTTDGIKAVLKVTPSQNMVDLLLYDFKTGKAITEAKVAVKVKGPDNKVQEKELLGMQMGEEFSFMNRLDTAKKGSYSFAIAVGIGKKNIKLNFVYEVK